MDALEGSLSRCKPLIFDSASNSVAVSVPPALNDVVDNTAVDAVSPCLVDLCTSIDETVVPTDELVTRTANQLAQTLEPVIPTVDPAVPHLDSVSVTENSASPTVDLVSVTVDTVNNREHNVFLQRSDGYLRNNIAAQKAKNRAVRKVVDSIKRAGVNNDQKSAALRSALMHEDIADISNRIGALKNINDSKAHQELVFCFDQLREICKEATKTNEAKGRTNDSKALFVETIFTGIVSGTGGDHLDQRRPGIKCLSKLFHQPEPTVRNIVGRRSASKGKIS